MDNNILKINWFQIAGCIGSLLWFCSTVFRRSGKIDGFKYVISNKLRILRGLTVLVLFLYFIEPMPGDLSEINILKDIYIMAFLLIYYFQFKEILRLLHRTSAVENIEERQKINLYIKRKKKDIKYCTIGAIFVISSIEIFLRFQFLSYRYDPNFLMSSTPPPKGHAQNQHGHWLQLLCIKQYC